MALDGLNNDISPRAIAWARTIQLQTQQHQLTLDELASLIQLVIIDERNHVLLKVEKALIQEIS